ncbi:MAG TPA: tetratricopeptide repeat protein [Terriglobales bacterium]|nr:tetratricopeptide repeat protein [Terriglobales bacterium]
MLGFGFNKTKVLASAERYVQQGKLQNAIAEYEKISKEDPKDITILNTIGDLYARLGQVDAAVNYFRKVGDHYATEGFTVKAIAMYKKLTKLNPSATESIQKLAELYTQQGLYNDARQQLMVVADGYIRANNHHEAARVFQKMLELDPENSSLQSKLADLYMKIGQKDDAKNIFLRATESLYQRGVKDGAAESLNKVLNIEPSNIRALQLKAQLALDKGDAAQAAHALEKIPDLDSRPDALKSLLQAYVQLGKVDEVAPCAKKLLSVHQDISGMKLYADTLLSTGKLKEAIGVYQEFADQLIAANGPATVQALDAYIGKVKDDPKALEDLNKLFQKAGDSSHSAEIMELLAHACVQQGDLTRARDLYKQLSEIEPENPLHIQNYKQIQARLGEDSTVRELSHEEGSQALMVEELETQEVLVEQHYSDLIASAIQAALTESDLFESYNVPNKALAPLEAVLPQAPQDVRLNQRLAAIYARLGRNTEAAQRCAVLQKVFSGSGLHDEAVKYGEMAAKYAQAGGTSVPVVESFTPEQISPATASEPKPSFSIEPEATTGKVEEFYFHQTPATEEPPPPAMSDASTAVPDVEPPAHAHEIDLSDEWENMVEVEAPAAVPEGPAASAVSRRVEPAPEAEPTPVIEPEPVAEGSTPAEPDSRIADGIEEVRFYISQEMWSEAAAAVDRLASVAPDIPEIEQFQRQILAAMVAESAKEMEPPVEVEPPAAPPVLSASEEELPTVAGFGFEEVAPADSQANDIIGIEERAPVLEVTAEPIPDQIAPEAETEEQEPVLQEWGEQSGNRVEEPVAAPIEAAPEHDVLEDFVSDLEASLGDDFMGSGNGAGSRPAVAPVSAPLPPATPEPAIAAFAATPAPERSPALSHETPIAHPAIAAVAATPAVAASSAAVATAPAPVGALGEEGTALLHDLFEEFKEDMEEGSGQTEDPETHYNLGVAFKEMGLLDEAIGELQKVCQAIDHGQVFSQNMQAFTWLANCFVEKGVPEASFKWYQKALSEAESEETRTAIHYELARAYEAAGMKPEAMRHFMEVYSANIDYRDVAERIKHLKS